MSSRKVFEHQRRVIHLKIRMADRLASVLLCVYFEFECKELRTLDKLLARIPCTIALPLSYTPCPMIWILSQKRVGLERMGTKRKAPNASPVHLFVLFYVKKVFRFFYAL